MPTATNPAKRLRSLLEHIRTSNPDVSMRDMWRKHFGLSHDDDRGLTCTILGVQALIEQVAMLVADKADGDELTAYTGCLANVRFVCSVQRLSETTGSVRGKLHDDLMARLEFCGLLIQKSWTDDTISTEDLEKLKSDIEALIAEIHSTSGIPASFREMLVRKLLEVKHAIDRYGVTGADGILESAAGAIGLLVTHGGQFVEWYNATLKGYIDVVRGIITVAGAAKHGAPMLEWIENTVKKLTGPE